MHLPFPRHDRTNHVKLDLRRCRGCGACAQACAREALGLLPYAIHRHAHVDRADRCRGCLRCVAACPHGAIRALRARGPLERGQGAR